MSLSELQEKLYFDARAVARYNGVDKERFNKAVDNLCQTVHDYQWVLENSYTDDCLVKENYEAKDD